MVAGFFLKYITNLCRTSYVFMYISERARKWVDKSSEDLLEYYYGIWNCSEPGANP